jgi:hypothetical protein
MIQPNSQAGQSIPPIPPIIPPPVAINAMSAMTTTPATINIIASVVLDIGLVISGEEISEMRVWERALRDYRPMIDYTSSAMSTAS